MHGGAIFGFQSVIERIPKEKDLIVLLDNTDSPKLLAIAFAFFGVDERYPPHDVIWRLLDSRRPATKVPMGKCPEYDRLYGEVENVVANLVQTTTFLLEVFRSKDLNAVHRLDKELELTVGEKERRIGALRQHIQEHKCVSPGNSKPAESPEPPRAAQK